MNDESLLTEDNWKQVVIDAVESLPPDIGGLVGWNDEATHRITVNVATPTVEDGEGKDGSDVDVIASVSYWDRGREYLVQRREEVFKVVGSPTGDEHFESLDHDTPVVMLCLAPVAMMANLGRETAYYIGHPSCVTIQQAIQRCILEWLVHAGGCEPTLVGKRENDARYYRPDGSLILAWQEREGPRAFEDDDDGPDEEEELDDDLDFDEEDFDFDDEEWDDEEGDEFEDEGDESE